MPMSPSNFYEKKIILGITGSIAAYKSILLLRLLKKKGADVQVVLTPDATNFVTPVALSTLSEKKVEIAMIENGGWINHIALANWADFIIIAPATANSLAKFSLGLCDNLLTAIFLSARCPIFIAPAMDEEMFNHYTTQKNIAQLAANGMQIIHPTEGFLASGLIGEGRLAEPEDILLFIEERLFRQAVFRGKKILITAGPTQEAIDPVRYISNRSSGKMGFALAEAFYQLGAKVTLIAGATQQTLKYADIHRINVVSAKEMYAACIDNFGESDIAIMCAAVADYAPTELSAIKIKKSLAPYALSLTPTIDILAELGRIKKQSQVLCGFALETNNETINAHKKLVTKNLDCIVLNSINEKNPAFEVGYNTINIITKDKNIAYENQSKKQLAEKIAFFIAENYCK